MKWLSAIALLGIALAAPASALADGGPALPVQGGGGISAPGSPYRYVAVRAGQHATAVRRLGGDAAVDAPSLRVAGAYGIPGVGSGGQLTGLAADGRTLVLAELFQGAAPPTTRLLVVDTPRLAVRARIACPGGPSSMRSPRTGAGSTSSTIRRPTTSAATRYACTTSSSARCSRDRSSTRTMTTKRTRCSGSPSPGW